MPLAQDIVIWESWRHSVGVDRDGSLCNPPPFLQSRTPFSPAVLAPFSPRPCPPWPSHSHPIASALSLLPVLAATILCAESEIWALSWVSCNIVKFTITRPNWARKVRELYLGTDLTYPHHLSVFFFSVSFIFFFHLKANSFLSFFFFFSSRERDPLSLYLLFLLIIFFVNIYYEV